MKRFARDEKGTLSVEAVLIMPILFWALAGMFVYWDAFRTRTVSLKAAYTISDMISRQTGPVDAAYLDGMNTIYDWLTASANPTRLRLSVVTTKLNADGTESLALVWSHGVGGPDPLTTLAPIKDHLPKPALGDQVIVVETFLDYAPIFRVGISEQVFSEVVVTRPRFVPQVIWRS